MRVRRHSDDPAAADRAFIPKPIRHEVLGALRIFLVGLAAIKGAATYLWIGTWMCSVTYPISIIMMLLTMTFYIHLRDSTVLVRIFAAAGYFWTMLLYASGLASYFTRPQIYLP
jgi:caa(3)-type oxidase subunit IV